MSRTRKAINFDLCTKKIKEVYPHKGLLGHLQAYKEIEHFLIKNGFEHRQWSGYISKNLMTNYEVADVINRLSSELPWLKECVNHFDVTDISKRFNYIDVIKGEKSVANEVEEQVTLKKPQKETHKKSINELLAEGKQRADAENAKNALNKASIHKKDVSL